jgi:hypothetical protein
VDGATWGQESRRASHFSPASLRSEEVRL